MRRTIDHFSDSAGQILNFVAILSIPAIIVWIAYSLGHSENLSCIKLETKHISCQLEKFHWYGLTSTPIEKFKLTKADVVERIEIDSEGDNFIYYQLMLYEKNKPILFYEQQKIMLFNNAKSDKERINKFVLKADLQESLNISSYAFMGLVKNIIICILFMLFSILFIIAFLTIVSLFLRVINSF